MDPSLVFYHSCVMYISWLLTARKKLPWLIHYFLIFALSPYSIYPYIYIYILDVWYDENINQLIKDLDPNTNKERPTTVWESRVWGDFQETKTLLLSLTLVSFFLWRFEYNIPKGYFSGLSYPWFASYVLFAPLLKGLGLII